jgi:muconolactone D-isomerase
MNNNILAIFTIATDNLPDNFQEVISHEQAVIAAWKADGLIEHLFLRPTRNGAVIVFKNVDDARAKELMESLPLYQFVLSVEYFPLMKQF